MKKIKNIIMVAMLAVTMCGLGLIGRDAFAMTKISIAPMSHRVALVPGEVYEGTLTVMNPATAEQDLNFIVEPGSYSVTSNGGSLDSYDGIDVETVGEANVIKNWITIENPTGTLEPNETTTVVYRIAVPRDAPAGGQYASLLVREDKSSDAASSEMSGINEVVQMASVIYAEVAGETRREGVILENKIPSFSLDGKIEATSMVENKGNVHTDAEYDFRVWANGSDEEICKTSDDQKTSIVLPDTKRYHQESCELPGIGIYKVKQVVKIFGEESVMEGTVIYCPIWVVLVVVFILVLLVIWIMMGLKKRKK